MVRPTRSSVDLCGSNQVPTSTARRSERPRSGVAAGRSGSPASGRCRSNRCSTRRTGRRDHAGARRKRQVDQDCHRPRQCIHDRVGQLEQRICFAGQTPVEVPAEARQHRRRAGHETLESSSGNTSRKSTIVTAATVLLFPSLPGNQEESQMADGSRHAGHSDIYRGPRQAAGGEVKNKLRWRRTTRLEASPNRGLTIFAP